MEYQVLARKCRPQTFEEVVGQEHVITTLKNTISLNRIAHAYLFSGSRGVGKTSIARILAKALNCVNGPTINPCGKCNSCLEIAQGNSMDVIEIDGASNRKIDQIRELREEVKFVPIAAKFKIYIIDEVHMLTQEAFNALLKTLEEPPPYIKFFFATTEPHKIPVTILSRCQRFDLRFIETEKIVARLKRIAKDENIELEEKAVYEIAKLASGSMRDAQSVFEKVIAFCDRRVSYQDLLSVLGLVDQEMFFEITESIIKKDLGEGLKVIHNVINNSSNLNQFLDGFMEHIRNLLMVLILQNTASGVVQMPEESLKRVQEQSRAFSEEQLLYIIEVLSQIKQEIKYALSSAVALEIGMIKIIKTSEIVSLKEIIAKLEGLEKELDSKVPEVREAASLKRGKKDKVLKPKNSSPELISEEKTKDEVFTEKQEKEISIEDVREIWPYFLEKLKRESRFVKSFLSKAKIVALTNGVLSLEIDKKTGAAVTEAQFKLIEKKAKEVIHEKLKVSFDFCEESEETKQEVKKVTGPGEVLDDPALKKTLEIFKEGKIIEIRRNN